jgi:DeoR-like protein with HTH domain
MGPQLWSIGCSCLVLIAVSGLLGLLIQRGGSWSWVLIFLAGGISLAIVHYQKGTLLSFLIVVVLLGLLGIYKKIGDTWSVVLLLLLLGISYPIASLSPRWPRRASPSPSQEQRLLQALHYVGEHGVITSTVYCELTGVSEEVARHDLEKLVKRGVLRAPGHSQAGHYQLP